MGVSTDAILFYGYVWEDEYELFDDPDGESDWAAIIAKKRGHKDPWVDHPGGRAQGWVDAHRAELDAWSAARKAIEEEYGVEISRHGSDQWAVPIIQIADVGFRAGRGYPKGITAGDLRTDPGWDAKLSKFINDLGIDIAEARPGPGWFIASWWG